MPLFSAAVGLVLVLGPVAQDAASPFRCWLAGERQRQLDYEAALNAVLAPASLRAYHELLGSEPHVAGTSGDERAIEKLKVAFDEMGLEVHVHEIWPLLVRPLEARLEIVGTIDDAAAQIPPAPPSATRRGVIGLGLKEDNLLDDPFTAHPDLSWGWNAYSGSGDVTAEIVYANYGTKEDFALLKERGIDVAGKIVIARYGKNFRGYKARFAEEAGAAGLLIYTDPADSGYSKGLPYPEGGWANDTCVQRGSIETLDYPGDPLTPFIEATKDADRLDAQSIALPRIPVQPIGWSAAQQIMSRMEGEPGVGVPDGWQGGLPFPYRLTGGPDLRVRLMVKQERAIMKTANVIATLRGSRWPEEKIIIGCHHDAWGFGAADPLAGTMVLMEAARSFAEAAQKGFKPARTLIFAAWGAEEFGIIGSTEWCEANRDDLLAHGMAYINLDMAAMGPNFGASASPSLRTLIAEAARAVPQARSATGESVFDAWIKREAVDGQPKFGDLGGGSDHIGFYCHLGIPSCGLGASGSQGTSYHSNYDTLAWYRQVVGEDYEPALMMTRIVNVLAARLGSATIVPLDPARYAPDTAGHLEALRKRAEALGVAVDFSQLERALTDYEREAIAAMDHLHAAIESEALDEHTIRAVNEVLIGLERAWLSEEGLPGRPWFRNLYAASDPDAGYAAWMLPALRGAIEQREALLVAFMQNHYLAAVQALGERMAEIDAALTGNSGSPP